MIVIRQRGYAVDNSEHEEGVRCIGAPIHNHEAEVMASISVSGPSQRMTPERDEEVGKLVMSKTAEISRSFGYREY